MMYVQCDMQKGNRFDTSWVEEKFAVIGRKVRRKVEDLDWEDGWVITQTFGKVSEEEAKSMRDLYKYHRKGTDI